MAKRSKLKMKLLRIALQINSVVIPLFSPGLSTRFIIRIYRKMGMRFEGRPNYISSRVNFDGTDYSLISIGEGVTISSYVRVLTHDWSLYTIAKAHGHFSDRPIGKIKAVSIGAYSFIGTGSIIMPGTTIGRGCLIGAGTVVRGNVPDHSIIIGSPGVIIGNTEEFVGRQLAKLADDANEKAV
ncbi:DapH/DapD/GlmU-related protein [Sphingopyxis sp. JAI108]|uniref:acyltransferase n=2 Tax=Sphingopyxis TaxID=165697 RepID=UPI0015CA907A|nr:acyltransferase [Sphingopyxis sp. JAI108]NYF32422.1 acetyltransferase-like isoleucine patch superfamily enzyme [Sphingopyxis sp. JAI108]